MRKVGKEEIGQFKWRRNTRLFIKKIRLNEIWEKKWEIISAIWNDENVVEKEWFLETKCNVCIMKGKRLCVRNRFWKKARNSKTVETIQYLCIVEIPWTLLI